MFSEKNLMRKIITYIKTSYNEPLTMLLHWVNSEENEYNLNNSSSLCRYLRRRRTDRSRCSCVADWTNYWADESDR